MVVQISRILNDYFTQFLRNCDTIPAAFELLIDC